MLDPAGAIRPAYAPLVERLEALPRPERRLLDHRMETALRELGADGWHCDLLPFLFERVEWEHAALGLRQRLRAFEHFLADLHGARDILRTGAVPIDVVLGSPYFQRAAVGLPPTRGHYLHLGSLCLRRSPAGILEIASQHFGRVHGLARMVQNRRLLARVAPELFRDQPVAPIADAPTALLETLRSAAEAGTREPLIVLLSPGPESPYHAEDGFLARRMGIPLVQGGDMVVLDDRVHLKTIGGLVRVHAILSSVAERWLDPLALEAGSYLGVAGLVHCLRKGSVALVNSLGSQLADDRAVLAFGARIVRHYLEESPILDTVPTFWLGDPDQREYVLADLASYRVLPLHGEQPPGPDQAAEIRRSPQLFVAQPADHGATTLSLANARRTEFRCDHLIFSLRRGENLEVFPGALTRLESDTPRRFQDTWVESEAEPSIVPLVAVPARRTAGRQVLTSRVAESLYWMGRYLERAGNLALLLQSIETLELEELNSSERKLYRPVWNRLLPPLEGSARRSIGSRRERYRLVLEADEFGTLANLLRRAWKNADAVQDVFSPEVAAVLAELRGVFERARISGTVTDEAGARVTRRLAEATSRAVAAFTGLCASSMLADDALRFCSLGRLLERAILTANATLACPRALAGMPTRETEIELSAFLRLLGTRDNYRRIYQTRAEPLAVLELLWKSEEAPRSVRRCLEECAQLLAEIFEGSVTDAHDPAAAVKALVERLRGMPWRNFFQSPAPHHSSADVEPPPEAPETGPLLNRLRELTRATTALHDEIADVFLNHQARVASTRPRESRGMDFDI